MIGIETHRRAVDHALEELGLGWDQWPEVVVHPDLTPQARLSAVLVLLAAAEADGSSPGGRVVVTSVGAEDDAVDWLGRARSPWQQLARTRLPWDPGTATTAVRVVTARGARDERRVALALRGAKQVCDQGTATVDLLDALQACVRHLEEADDLMGGPELARLAHRLIASTAPPELLDLSLLVDGDAWAGPARAVAVALPSDEVAPLVRLLGDLGPRRPSRRWLGAVDAAARPPAARWLLRRWLELAEATDVVPEWAGSEIGDCRGTLFVGTNTDIVRAAVWAAGRLPDEPWPPAVLGNLARRGSAHNGAPGLPEALALKVATAAVDTLITRGDADSRRVLTMLQQQLARRDLLAKVNAHLA